MGLWSQCCLVAVHTFVFYDFLQARPVNASLGLRLRAGYEQLAKFYETPPGSASTLASRAGPAANLSASAFMVPLTLRHFPVNAAANQAAAPSAAMPGRRLLQPPTVPLAQFYDAACEHPAEPPHALTVLVS